VKNSAQLASKLDKFLDSGNWKSRIGYSFTAVLFGLFWIGFGFLGIELFGVTGPEGAVIIDGGLVFMPLGGAIGKYIVLFVCGLGLVIGYPSFLIGLAGIPISVVLMVVSRLREKARYRRRR
jgi:hypothetical protein